MFFYQERTEDKNRAFDLINGEYEHCSTAVPIVG